MKYAFASKPCVESKASCGEQPIICAALPSYSPKGTKSNEAWDSWMGSAEEWSQPYDVWTHGSTHLSLRDGHPTGVGILHGFVNDITWTRRFGRAQPRLPDSVLFVYFGLSVSGATVLDPQYEA